MEKMQAKEDRPVPKLSIRKTKIFLWIWVVIGLINSALVFILATGIVDIKGSSWRVIDGRYVDINILIREYTFLYCIAGFAVGLFFMHILQKEKLPKYIEYRLIAKYLFWLSLIILFFGLLLTPSLLCSRIGAQNSGAECSINAMLTACETFNREKYGQSDKLDKKYLGYPRQTLDLYDAEIETPAGPERIKGVDKSFCAKEGGDGNSGGFVFRYTVLKKKLDLTSGETRNIDYMISACPEEPMVSGTVILIGRSSTTGQEIYKRFITHVETREEMLITEWPSEEELDADWKSVSN